jgi:D-alanyl-lipoteichoic acid acyltransferase DltB (MBOAT superfamily)
MNFVSFEFGVFMALVFVLYWRLPAKARSGFLLVASWFFYAAWDWRFLGLLAVSTIVDYSVALMMARSRERSGAGYPGARPSALARRRKGKPSMPSPTSRGRRR